MLYVAMESDIRTLSLMNILVKYADDTNLLVPADTDLDLTQEFNSIKHWAAENKRNSSGDEIANVNFPYDNIVHALQNTIHSCINSTTDRRRYVLEHRFIKFSEITQCNGHYTVQDRSRSPILVPIESSYTTSD